jgi:hypothetical protein
MSMCTQSRGRGADANGARRRAWRRYSRCRLGSSAIWDALAPIFICDRPFLQDLDNGMRAAGMLADGRRRWRVQEIMQERGRGARAEALIRWEGFDPRSGQPWPDSWERVSGLTADLRELAFVRVSFEKGQISFRNFAASHHIFSFPQ